MKTVYLVFKYFCLGSDKVFLDYLKICAMDLNNVIFRIEKISNIFEFYVSCKNVKI